MYKYICIKNVRYNIIIIYVIRGALLDGKELVLQQLPDVEIKKKYLI